MEVWDKMNLPVFLQGSYPMYTSKHIKNLKGCYFSFRKYLAESDHTAHKHIIGVRVAPPEQKK